MGLSKVHFEKESRRKREVRPDEHWVLLCLGVRQRRKQQKKTKSGSVKIGRELTEVQEKQSFQEALLLSCEVRSALWTWSHLSYLVALVTEMLLILGVPAQ